MPPFRPMLLLCMIVSLVAWQTGSSAANEGNRTTVQSVEVTSEQVTIHLSSASAYTQAALPKDPLHGRAARCYVDIEGVLGRQAERWYFGDARRVEQVRLAQFQPQTVRVVLDLLTAQPCRVEQAVNPARLVVTVGRSTQQSHTTSARLRPPAKPPAQTVQQQPPPEQPPDHVVQQQPPAELQASGALEYLDLRTPFSSETPPTQAISLFDRQTTEETATQLSLLDRQTTEGTTAQLSLFSQQALDDKTLQLAPRGLYLLQE